MAGVETVIQSVYLDTPHNITIGAMVTGTSPRPALVFSRSCSTDSGTILHVNFKHEK